MKQTAGNFWKIVLMGLALSGCDESANEEAEPAAKQKSVVSEAPPAKGMCAGWRNSLEKGRHVGDVESCLRQKALANRPEAVEEAKEMMDWKIKETDFSQLKPLIAALSKYPEAGSLRRYLKTQSLLPNDPDKYSRLDQALTASDYIRELGNIHWFDAETGMFPNHHDYLLKEVAALSDLKNTDFTEVPPSDYGAEDEPYVLKATVNGKAYQKKAGNYGDWYDVGAVLMLLNEIAVDQSRQSRFVTLQTGDQTAIIWVVENNTLNSLLDQGLVRLSPEELSMKTGKAFEAKVKKQLRDKGVEILSTDP